MIFFDVSNCSNAAPSRSVGGFKLYLKMGEKNEKR